MTRCGAGWKKKDKNDNPYISFSIDKPLLPFTIDEKKMIAAYPVKDKKTENSPDFWLDVFIPEKQIEDKYKENIDEFI